MELWATALLSGGLAGILAVVITRLIEKFGGIVGGVLGTLPTTIIMTSIGFWYALDSTSDFQAAMYVGPIGMLFNGGVLACWRYIPQLAFVKRMSSRGRFFFTLTSSLVFWCACSGAAFGIIRYVLSGNVKTLLFASIGFSVALLALGVAMSLNNPGAPKGSHPVPWTMLLLRGFFAASCILGVIFLSTTSSVAAGLLAMFPVIFTTTMISLWVSQGSDVQIGAIGPMVLGSTSVSLYGVLLGLLAPIWGLPAAVVGVWFICLATISIPSVLFLRRIMQSRAKTEQPPAPTAPPPSSLPTSLPAVTPNPLEPQDSEAPVDLRTKEPELIVESIEQPESTTVQITKL
eukprot:m.64040 g.64040  ORF g.64040 m.64040 type:complete len:346 (+) comp12500_c0_seq1:38-1075(+)